MVKRALKKFAPEPICCVGAKRKVFFSDYRDKVVLHMLPRQTEKCLNPSPFVIKLETFLRMAEIPYEVTHDKFSHAKTGKTPWINWRGKDLADTALIMQALAKDTGKDLDERLTAHERSVARAFQKMIDESTYWSVFDENVFFG